MRRVIFGDAAVAEIEAITNFIAQDKPRAAEDVRSRLYAAALGLSEFPERGEQVGRFRRLATVRPYLISYRILRDGSISILSVRHGAQRR